jgi:hypothetical protein
MRSFIASSSLPEVRQCFYSTVLMSVLGCQVISYKFCYTGGKFATGVNDTGGKQWE